MFANLAIEDGGPALQGLQTNWRFSLGIATSFLWSFGAVEVTNGDGPNHGMTHGHKPAVGMWGPYNSGECYISTELTGTGPAYLT